MGRGSWGPLWLLSADGGDARDAPEEDGVINSAAPVRIVGQGLAGTMLGGARTWEIYTHLERELACPLVRELRIRRLFRSEKERTTMQARLDRPEVATWVESADADGLWMRGAFQVDTAALIGAMRRRWVAKGWLVEAEVTTRDDKDCPTIWCVGAGVREHAVGVAAWELSKGELLSGHMMGIDEEVVLNDGQWILPLGAGRVRVGATFIRDDLSLAPSGQGGEELWAAARRLSKVPLTDVTVDVGLRVNVPRRRPVVGWTDEGKRVGIIAGLAAKGALWAPVLAEQWVADDLDGGQLEIETRPGPRRRI